MTTEQWYLLQCKLPQQARAEWHLAQQGFATYIPQHRVKHLSRGRVETRTEALFPGYVFIQLNAESNWRALRATRGVTRVVSFNGAPHPVPAGLVAALRQRTAQAEDPAPLFKKGERVTITEGCFQHIEAIVKGVTADERIIVLLSLLQSEQALEMNPAQLARVG